MKITVSLPGLRVKAVDSMTKVFADEEPQAAGEPENRVLRGDRLSFQLALSGDPAAEEWRKPAMRFVQAEVRFPETEWITVRSVENVPVRYATHAGAPDSLYVRKTPGLYPDVLQELKHGVFSVQAGSWRAVWIDIEVPETAEPGARALTILMKDPVSGEELTRTEMTVTVEKTVLSRQTFPRTEWFHADCLADVYHTEVFSERHWELLEKWIRRAVRRGINMILTPQFTPPLDTAVGWERPTVQLVEVWREENGYRFDFSRLKRWIRMGLDCGVLYFEMSHLFSQWGAVAAPKIMGWEQGAKKQLFGWDTPAAGGEYARFLEAYLPALREVLREYNVEDRCFFHISDEPALHQLESYAAARESVKKALDRCRFIEALSDYAFYEKGMVETPVCGTNHLAPFLEHGTPRLWTYYCTAQVNHVSNCFIAQRAGVTRLYGAQMYKFGIEGTLRWGFNFYYTAESYEQINPYLINDSGGCYPAGDAFLVYPGADGEPVDSIRLMVLDDAIRDLRVLKALEEKTGREAVIRMIDEELPEPLTFEAFPDGSEAERYILRLRRKVMEALCAD